MSRVVKNERELKWSMYGGSFANASARSWPKNKLQRKRQQQQEQKRDMGHKKATVERSNVTSIYYQKLEKRKQIIVRSKCLLKFLPTIKWTIYVKFSFDGTITTECNASIQHPSARFCPQQLINFQIVLIRAWLLRKHFIIMKNSWWGIL